MYVDDVVTAGDLEKVITLQEKYMELIKTGSFSLHKWNPNLESLECKTNENIHENKIQQTHIKIRF